MSEPQYPSPPENGALNIELSADIAEGTYANLVMIAHSSEEFIFDFIRVMPGVAQARVKSRIIVTPAHAKRLLGAIAENLARYENTYGEITDVHLSGPDAFRFDGPGGEA